MNEYFRDYAEGLGKAVVSDPIVTSLALGSAAVAIRHGATAGVATFFLGYTGMAEITNLALTLGGGARGLALAIRGDGEPSPILRPVA